MTDDNSPALSMGITGREPMLGGAKKIRANALYIEGIGRCEFSLHHYSDEEAFYIEYVELDSHEDKGKASRGVAGIYHYPGRYQLVDVTIGEIENGKTSLNFRVERIGD